MRNITLTGLVGVAAVVTVCPVAAQTPTAFPTKPIRVIVSSAPGGMGDTVTRLVTYKMGEDLGQLMIVENRAGGGTTLGTRAVKAAAPDGYTLLATSNSITSVPSLQHNPGYDALKDFAPIGQMVRSPWFLVIGGSQPDRTLGDLLARAKAAPGALSFASSGTGASPHLATEAFVRRAGVQAVHVPYKGNGAAMPDVISGRVTMMLEGPAAAMPKVKGGQFKVLGVTSANRLEAFPDVPKIGRAHV